MKFKIPLVYSVIAGCIFGIVIFFFVVRSAYSKLETSIYNSKALSYLVNSDPALYSLLIKSNYVSITYDSLKKYEEQFAWRILLNTGILTSEDNEDDVGVLIAEPLHELIRNEDLQEVLDLTSLELITELLNNISDKNQDYGEWNENLLHGMAKCLANQPKAFENYEQAVSEEKPIEFAGSLAYWFPRGLTSRWGTIQKAKNLIELLFTHFHISEEFVDLTIRRPRGQENLEEYRQLREFIQTLLVAIGNDPSVEKARNKVVIYHGIMQFFMFIAFFIAFFFVVQKLLYNLGYVTISERSQRNLPKFFSWLLNTIPIMGFVGTIIGLMRALADADQIPLAVGNISTSLSISEVTETLSIAFTTTLMAFVMVIILGLINLSTQYFFVKDILDNDEQAS
ncbi:MotA/TolQ/ExbB proton channel family protein [Fulvivirgaceae bacterium BMA12]|uniref:MotA/TolQ/ExbB proton channel family protein n=1 Tax=Agaribacillus aureus TaxID=3051825 RepID=A0ABT8LB80_9BACT|nr:MotA/TolQ/ExbB proton channel family protein [Fulvivirgaceae bacterium BMA12]